MRPSERPAGSTTGIKSMTKSKRKKTVVGTRSSDARKRGTRAKPRDVPPVQPVPWDWRDTDKLSPNVGWTCYGEDSGGRIQKMFLAPDGRWWHHWLNKPLEFRPKRWCYEVPSTKVNIAAE